VARPVQDREPADDRPAQKQNNERGAHYS
jgi:hypothetical protein